MNNTLKQNLKKVIELNPHTFQITNLVKGYVDNNLTISGLIEYNPINGHPIEIDGYIYRLLIVVENKHYILGSNIPFPPIKEWYND